MANTSMQSNHCMGTSRKYLLLSVLLVLLTFPQASYELSFKFGGGGDDAADAESTKQVATKRRTAARKFKFHKIDRIYVDEEEDDDDGGEDDDDNGSDAGQAADDDDERRYQRKNSDDDDDNNKWRSLRHKRRESEDEEEEENKFKRAHKANKDRQNSKSRKTKKRGENKDNDDDDDDDDGDEDQATESWFSTLFGMVFGGSKKEKAVAVEESASNGNDIITWLNWITEKIGKAKPPPEPEESTLESWLSYLNRWPFNTLFPFGQPEKPIRVPRRTSARRANNDRDDNSAEAEPMSQEHFESLLHTLPDFVANPAHVRNQECRQQLQVFHRQLRGNKLWTLQMLDATGKISTGLLRGNINQFGDFEQCTQARAAVKVTPDIAMRIRGKYCLAHIEMQTDVPELKLPVYLAHGRGLWNSHLGNPGHFVPRYAVANWGICIPHLCPAEVVKEMIETNLRPYNKTGVDIHVDVDDDDCYTRQSNRFFKLLKKDNKFALTVFHLSFLVLLMVAAFLFEQWTQIKEAIRSQLSKLKFFKSSNSETAAEANGEAKVADGPDEAAQPEDEAPASIDVRDEEANAGESADVQEEELNVESTENTSLKSLALEIFKSFSPKRTLSVLLSQDHVDMQFPIFHVLKLLATFMLYICFKFLMVGHLPITNRDQLVRSLDQPYSVFFRAPLIYTDVLLLISGFLSAYQLSEEMAQKSYIQLLKRLASKMARYLPTLYVVLCLQTWILPHLGSGPLWTNLIGQNAQLCEQQMWRNVFSVQNAIDFEETCSPMSVQLALEMQLFLLAPLIVWLYYTDADAGFFVYGAVHALSVAARFSRTNREHLSMTLFHGMNLSKFYRTANMLYSSPISRATPYLLGIGAGLLHRTQEGNLEIAPDLVPVGWALAALSVLWCFWTPTSGMRTDFIYKTSDAASYAAWSPLLLGLALVWLIFMFPKNDSSVIRFLTTSRPMLFLSRITFPIQLMTYVVVLYNTANVKESLKYHISDLLNFNEIAIILALATLLAFIIDIPAQHIRRVLVNRIFKERPPQDDEPISGAEHSESEAAGDGSERVTSDTPEPPDTIWASDPEEEEQKYIERRRSSTASVTTEKDKKVEAKQEDEEEEEEEETDIAEEDEVKKRPESAQVKETEVEQPTNTRRRRPTSDD